MKNENKISSASKFLLSLVAVIALSVGLQAFGMDESKSATFFYDNNSDVEVDNYEYINDISQYRVTGAVGNALLKKYTLEAIKAIEQNNKKAFENIYNRGIINTGRIYINKKNETLLNIACKLNNLDIVNILIVDFKSCINQADDNGETALYWACCNNNINMVELLLNNGAKESINKSNKKGRTPLYWACYHNNINMVRLCLNNGARESINKVDSDGETPFYWACFNDNLDMVTLLLNNGAKESINIANKEGRTPLYWACFNNNINMVRLCLNNGAREFINKADVYGESPLYWACKNNNLAMSKLLLDNGAKESVNRADNYGKNPLYWACKNKNLKIIELLLPYCTKESINQAYRYGFIILNWACYNNNLEMVKSLLDNGAKEFVNKVDSDGKFPLYWACFNDNPEMVELLLNNGAKESVNTANSDGETIFNYACKKYSSHIPWFDNLEIVILLLPYCKKETICKAGNYELTPFYCGCYHNKIAIVKLWLDNGAKEIINIANKEGRTPLYWACWHNNLEMLKLFLDNGAKETINKADDNRRTPLYWACYHKNPKMVRLLLDNGAKEIINKADKDGNTPLYLACHFNNPKMVRLLLEYGADVDQIALNKARMRVQDQNLDAEGRAIATQILNTLNLAKEYRASLNKKQFIIDYKGSDFLIKLALVDAVRLNDREWAKILFAQIKFDESFINNTNNNVIKYALKTNNIDQTGLSIRTYIKDWMKTIVINEYFIDNTNQDIIKHAIESFLEDKNEKTISKFVNDSASLFEFDYSFINNTNQNIIKVLIAADAKDKKGVSIIDAVMVNDINCKYIHLIFEKHIGANNTNKINETLNKVLKDIRDIKKAANKLNKKRLYRNLENSFIVINDLVGMHIEDDEKVKIHDLPLDTLGIVMSFAGSDFGKKVDAKCLAANCKLKREKEEAEPLIKLSILDAIGLNDCKLVKSLFAKIEFHGNFINNTNDKIIKYAIATRAKDKKGVSIIDAVMANDINCRYIHLIFEECIVETDTDQINEILKETLEDIKKDANKLTKKSLYRNLENSFIVINDLVGMSTKITKEKMNENSMKKMKKISMHNLPLGTLGRVMSFAGSDFGEKVDAKCIAANRKLKREQEKSGESKDIQMH